MNAIDRAIAFEKVNLRALSTSDRVKLSREAKDIILSVNELYKKNKEEKLMDLMKRITAIKKKVEKRLQKVPRI